MSELKWGFAIQCTPHVHNTEDAILVPHPASPCAEPLRQLCPCSCQLPARQQKAEGMGQCHEPMTFQPTHKATWRMRCLKSHFRFKEQHFHFSWKSPCALSPAAPRVTALSWVQLHQAAASASDANPSPLCCSFFEEAAVVSDPDDYPVRGPTGQVVRVLELPDPLPVWEHHRRALLTTRSPRTWQKDVCADGEHSNGIPMCCCNEVLELVCFLCTERSKYELLKLLEISWRETTVRGRVVHPCSI